MELSIMSLALYFFLAIFGIVAVIGIFGAFFTVDQQTRRVVTRFGKFVRVASPGLGWKVPFIDRVSQPISLRVQQLDLTELTYTDKGTSVTIQANVQYVVDENDGSVQQAFYKLSTPEGQIKSHVSSSIRAKVPQMTLEAVQKNQAEIAGHVKAELTETMRQYGYIIADVLVTKADPDQSVVQANNEKYASEQAKVTAENTAAANFTRVVQSAKADAEAMEAHGKGIAKERAAIIAGLQESVKAFESAVPGTTAADAMRLVAYQQYVDAMVKLGNTGNSKIIFMPTGGGAVADLMSQITSSILTGVEASKGSGASAPAAPSANSGE